MAEAAGQPPTAGEPATSTEAPSATEPRKSGQLARPSAAVQEKKEEKEKDEGFRTIPKSVKEEGKAKRQKVADKLKLAKGGRQYLGWLDANDIEWRTYMEFTANKRWKEKFGPGTEWHNRYEKWICSGMTRGAMRKPSYRGLEWLKYQRGIEIAPVGERCTRRRISIRDYFIEPVDNYCCRPCPWPRVTSGEVGWLGQHEKCQLEIYPNDFMKKPPLPWWQAKPSTFQPGNM